jgi:hypothetical protein
MDILVPIACWQWNPVTLQFIQHLMNTRLYNVLRKLTNESTNKPHGTEFFWEPNSRSTSKDIPCVLRNQKIHYRVGNSLILSQMNLSLSDFTTAWFVVRRKHKFGLCPWMQFTKPPRIGNWFYLSSVPWFESSSTDMPNTVGLLSYSIYLKKETEANSKMNWF